MSLILFSLLIALAVGAAAYAAWTQSASDKDPMTARLRQLRTMRVSPARAAYEERPPFLLDMIARLGGFLPSSDGRNALQTGLIRAGFRSQQAVVLFLGIKLVLAVTLPILWLAFAALTGRPFGNAVLMTIVFALIGFYAPTMFIGWRQRRRYQEIVSTLPDALDLLVICVESGLGMTAALQRVGAELQTGTPALADEFALVHQQMQAGVSRPDALRNLAQRTGVEDVYSLVAMLIQTDRLGTGIAHALRAHAESMRIKRRQRAEQMARKAAIKLAFPLIFLVLPALLIVILGPAAIELIKALSSQ